MLAFAYKTFLFERAQILGDGGQTQSEFPFQNLFGRGVVRVQISGQGSLVELLHCHGRRGFHVCSFADDVLLRPIIPLQKYF